MLVRPDDVQAFLHSEFLLSARLSLRLFVKVKTPPAGVNLFFGTLGGKSSRASKPTEADRGCECSAYDSSPSSEAVL
jgi:hypothetical protein